jgi:outer membrane protein
MLRFNRFHLLTAVCAFFCSAAAWGQIKLAIVNTQKAILDTAEIQKEQTAMEAKFKPRQDAIQKLQKELQDIQEQLQKMQGKLSPDAERDLSAKGRRVQTELQRTQEDLQADVENHRNDVLQRVGRQMQAVVQKLAEEKGFDVVMDSANTVYFKTALEITAEATAAYDKTYPVK